VCSGAKTGTCRIPTSGNDKIFKAQGKLTRR
jgi:hypothetical protein